MFRSPLLVGAVGALALTLATPTSAPAAPVSDPIVTGLAGPLQIDLGGNGNIYVAQSFASTLTKVRANGTTQDLLSEPGGEARDVSGVSSGAYGVAYTTTFFDPSAREGLLKVRRPSGHVVKVADLWKFEKKNNPDAAATYGFLNLSNRCAHQVPAEIGGEPYNGLRDAHPYALADAPGGGWYVADAGANAVLRVSPRGGIEVVAVLPRQKTKVTASAADALGLPACTIGKTYAFEPVPTDVEVAGSGRLIVSLLPGGPEDESLGARGAVYQIKIAGGGAQHGGSTTLTRLAGGFLGATNVAYGGNDRIFVTEMFGNKVSLLRRGVVSKVASLPNPGSVEYKDGKLYVSYDVFGNGSIATVRVGRS